MRKVILGSLWLGPELGVPTRQALDSAAQEARLLCLGVKRCFQGAWLAYKLDSWL